MSAETNESTCRHCHVRIVRGSMNWLHDNGEDLYYKFCKITTAVPTPIAGPPATFRS